VAARERTFNHATDKDQVMAHWKKAFPGKFLQVSDLDTPIVATIASVRIENVGNEEDGERKPVVRFQEPDVKSLVCNLTRAESIAAIAGDDDVDNWVGTRIRIVRGTTRFQGKKVSCISVEPPTRTAEAF